MVNDHRIRELHIEPSTRCTLACIHCPRTQYPDQVKIADIDIDDVVRACHGVVNLSMCGDHGDPIYHPRLHELVRRVKESFPYIRIWINTNGAFRGVDWWEQLGLLLDGNDSITFSIDGLPHNNHIYRTNSRWDTIENGILAIRRTNPALELVWKWIIFNYNQDDVPRGIRLAKRLGFNRFQVIGSTRTEDHDPVHATKSLHDIREELDAVGIPTL